MREVWHRDPDVQGSAIRDGIVVPRVIANAGDQAARRFLEFFAATIRNKNTRMEYLRAACDFFSWCDRHHIGGIADIEPLHVAAYIENLQHAMPKPTDCFPGLTVRRAPTALPSISGNGTKALTATLGLPMVASADVDLGENRDYTLTFFDAVADASCFDNCSDRVGSRWRTGLLITIYSF